MKKILLLVVLAVLVLVPVTAANDLAVGLNLGTTAGVGARYRMDDFDIVGNLSIGFIGGSNLAIDAAANYKVYDFEINNEPFDVTVGGGLALAIPLGNGAFRMEVIVPVGLNYSLKNNDLPLDFYLRVGPSIRVIRDSSVSLIGGYGVIGALWRF